MVRVPSLALAVLAALGVLAASAGAATFKTPSGNIGCLYTPASGSASVSLRCDLASVAHTPPRPKSCHQVYGQAFLLSGTGRAKRGCVGDTIMDSRASTLRYGVKRKYGPFTCTSRQSGLTCTSRYRHGFTLSKDKQKLW
jgi:uncharacterized protein DUF6636